LTNHKKGCFAVNLTVSTYSVSKKYRLSLREVLREIVLREKKPFQCGLRCGLKIACFAAYTLRTIFCVLKKPVLVDTSVDTNKKGAICP
jgi:hypothetical protein